MVRLYLIRHSEAEGNLYRRCHGQYNSLITTRAARQIERLAKRFADIHLDGIYSSDLYRAYMTAKGIADSKNMTVEPRAGLREMYMGKWEDLPWGEIPRRYSDEYYNWEHLPSITKIPEGETVPELTKRIDEAIRGVVAENRGKTIAIVSHGAAIRAFLCYTYGWPMDRMKDIGWCDNTAVSLIDFDDSGKASIQWINDNSHLTGEHSTLAAQKWWRDEDRAVDYNMWFRPAVLPQDKELLLYFGREFAKSAYGDSQAIDADAFSAKLNQLQDISKRAVVFSMIGEKEVGAVVLNVADEKRENAGLIQMLCLREEYRGRDFAPQLLGHGISVYRAMGKKSVYAKVSKQNARALAFYQKSGFHKAGALPEHIVMERGIEVRAAN